MSAARSASVRWALVGLVGSVALIALKGLGYVVTGSAAMLSDALESLVHLVTSSFALYAVWLGGLPRDANHPYGHGKVEYLSAAVEGVLVLVAGVGVAIIGVRRLAAPVELPSMWLGAGFSLAAALIALLLGQLLLRAGRRLNSPTLEADGVHIRADALTSFGAFFGLAVVALTGWVVLDALIALGLGLWLIWHGGVVVRAAVGGILDEVRPGLLDRIGQSLLVAREPGWILPHATKVHRLGQAVHIDLHLVFPRYWPLERAHAASHAAADAIRREFGDETDVMVHLESCEPTNCVACDVDDCPVRSAASDGIGDWRGSWISRRLR
ncbi:MAG: cation transporter [Myxococcales bacterium]|nr:cation transporter [Myxococcales bacterium]MCB9521118.1 cation transporter [Myxococcales bacterium]MCB9531866.1 cation transporter [Myxococcales bacterium]